MSGSIGSNANFTAAQMTAIRRYCGYTAYAAYGYVLSPDMATLDVQCAAMSASEVQVVLTTFLPNLATLETAILGASANLDTDVAAVWTHNKNEVADRVGLFNYWRRRLCTFIGCVPGPDLRGGACVVRG